MKLFKQIDLTIGKPWKVIIYLAIPIFLSQILGNAFSLINALVLKTTVGGDSVTAINSTGSISSVLFQFAYGCSGGFAIMLSSYYGKKDFENLKKSFYNAIYLCLLIGVVITVLGLIVYKDLLVLLNVDERYLLKAQNYYFILLLSFVFMLLANFLGNALRAIGDSTAPLLISLCSTFVNICFAFLFTGLIKLDTRGVALATLIANLTNIIISLIYMLRKYEYFSIKGQIVKINKKFCFSMLKLGVPLGLQWSILFIGSFFQARTINGFGNGLATKAVSCYSPIESYLCMPLSAIANALLSFVAQNYGNGDIKRIKNGVIDALIIDLISWIVILLIGAIIAPYAPYIFMPKEEINDVINGPIIKYYCLTYLKIIIPCLLLQSLLTISRSILQGCQKTLIPFLSGVGELVARICVCAIIPSLINPSNPVSAESYIGVCFSSPMAWLVSVIIMGFSAIYILNKKLKQYNIYS